MQLTLAADHVQRRQPWFALRGPLAGACIDRPSVSNEVVAV